MTVNERNELSTRICVKICKSNCHKHLSRYRTRYLPQDSTISVSVYRSFLEAILHRESVMILTKGIVLRTSTGSEWHTGGYGVPTRSAEKCVLRRTTRCRVLGGREGGRWWARVFRNPREAFTSRCAQQRVIYLSA